MTKKQVEESNKAKKQHKKEANATLRKIKRHKAYQDEEYERKINIYAATHNMNRKGAAERLESFSKKIEKKKQPKKEPKPKKEQKYKFVQTTPIRGDNAGKTLRKRIDYNTYNEITSLQAEANRRAKAAGLNYTYDFNFATKEGARKYLSLLENITSDEEYFNNVAMKRDAQFIENMKSSYSAISSMLDDEDDIKLVESTLKKLSKIRTPEQARKIYQKLRDRYDASELSVYIFSSNAPGELQEADIEALKLINDIIKEL